MRAMVLERQREPLRPVRAARSRAGPGQVLISVAACGVCRTDLHIVDGDLTEPKLPLVPGHQIVGTVVGAGEGAERFALGDRVGVPWLGWTCGECRYCPSGRENLCDRARFTGYDIDGGYAELAVADAALLLPDPGRLPRRAGGAAALRRADRLPGAAPGRRRRAARLLRLRRLGPHPLPGRRRIRAGASSPSPARATRRARSSPASLGAEWAGSSTEPPPEELDGAIVFAPVGPLMTAALRVSAKGARIISAGIHMSDIPSFPYEILWGERMLGSVANLTRRDGEEFLAAGAAGPGRTEVEVHPLARTTRRSTRSGRPPARGRRPRHRRLTAQ